MSLPPFFPGQRWLRLGAGLGLLMALGLLAWLPEKGEIFSPTSCVFHAMTGLPCVLCGGTRSARALLHGDFTRAWQLNALAFPAVGFLFLAAIALIVEASRTKPLADWPYLSHRALCFWPFALCFLLVWWALQINGALCGSKSELLDLRNPVARSLNTWVHR